MMRIPAQFTRLFQKRPTAASLQELHTQNETLSRQLKILVSDIQGSTDITTNTDSTATRSYVGTPSRYSSYDTQVTQLGKLYDNIADWGCLCAKNIIDMRAAFTLGGGIEVVKNPIYKGTAEREIEWVQEFMQANSLNDKMPVEHAKEAEIEGKILLRFLLDDNSTIRVVHTPWRQYKYTVYTPGWDYYDYYKAYYVGGAEPRVQFGEDGYMTSPWFVYNRFGGGANKVNETPPKTAFVLREIEDLDKAIWDWRKINRLFSAPTPVIYCQDESTAKKISTWVESSNWRLGKLLILGGLGVKFELVGWKGDGYTTIQNETETLVKSISGATGIPAHFLGYPELLSNRDTAENLMGFISLSTAREHSIWEDTYTELFRKAITLSNAAYGTSLTPEAVSAKVKMLDMGTTPEPETTPKDKPNAPVSDRNDTSSE